MLHSISFIRLFFMADLHDKTNPEKKAVCLFFGIVYVVRRKQQS